MTLTNIEKAIDVQAPVRTVYNQWTQFEDFPRFMNGIKEVKQLDDKQLFWRASVGGKEKVWKALITEQIADSRIAWKSIEGVNNSGVVTFHRIADNTTRVMLQIAYDTQGFVENAADMFGLFERNIETSLQGFKKFIEERGEESGAWRGEIRQEKK